MSEDILAVWSSSNVNGVRNFEYGIETQTWGFKEFRSDYTRAIRWILFGYSHSNGSPRMLEDHWRRGIADVVLCEVSGGLYTGHAPHWPDEVEMSRVIYPYRFGATIVGSAAGVSFDASGPLGPEGNKALRLSGAGNCGVYFRRDLKDLCATMQAPARVSSFPPARGTRAAPGTSQDPALNTALERHAVRMATGHYYENGWDEVEGTTTATGWTGRINRR